jgi:hypothetical protein
MVLQPLEDTTAEEMLRDSILMPYYKPGYVLLYGPDQFFYQSKLFATVYERLVKARELINEKVRQEVFAPDNGCESEDAELIKAAPDSQKQ